MKILFICKKNELYGFSTYTRRSSGLYNSTRFIVEGLVERGIDAKIIEVVDNNCIDREVRAFKPDVVIIEALWVVPEKFPILMKLHPDVQWCVHLHSHMPFLALEGIAMEWIHRYAQQGIGLIANSEASYDALRCILSEDELIYLPNVYRGEMLKPKFKHKRHSHAVHIGCFGAVRPLKNHLLQALAAIRFADEIQKPLGFWVNATRVETLGGPVLKNLRQLFADQPNATLIESPWNEPEDFIKLLSSTIDIGMQVSLSETFNVVSADYVTAGVPVVVSKEVSWVSKYCKAKDDDVNDIVRIMHRVHHNAELVRLNQYWLSRYSKTAQDMWFEFCQEAMIRD